ncbi:MAG TPA: LLM class flavin-dependent oxidoreductase [Candidatus Thermoplasmatota archaeon]|nr:LLM class flavin-dependent oxidoreductase [Candidatus Thermoplasmatota archaeon]
MAAQPTPSRKGMELGIYTFGDVFPNPFTGEPTSHKQRMRDIVRWAKLADEVGLDVFAVGEHHRLDMVVSSPPVVLASVAEATKRIKLSSSTTLLNTLDPVRVYEDFATLDLLSDGRAEMIVGRGSFTESFPLFGYDLEDYDALFAEKIDLLLKLNTQERVTWQGTYRPPLKDAEISPRAERPIPIWVGVGGTPQSAARAGVLGLPLNLAILGGPQRFPPLIDLYRHAGAQAGHDPAKLRVAISSHGYIGEDGAQAREEHYRIYSGFMRKGLRNRFRPMEIPRDHYEHEAGPRGGIFAGEAKEIVEKIRWEHQLFGHNRTLLQLDWGGIPSAKVERMIEILGTEVAPAVREAIP